MIHDNACEQHCCHAHDAVADASKASEPAQYVMRKQVSVKADQIGRVGVDCEGCQADEAKRNQIIGGERYKNGNCGQTCRGAELEGM